MWTSTNSLKGYIYEVDLEVPAEVHEKHSDYPLAPENFEITPEMYSPFQDKFPDTQKKKGVKSWLQTCSIRIDTSVTTETCNFI